MLYRRHLCSGEKRGAGVGKTKRGKGSKVMAVADGTGLPIAISVTSASPHEVTLVSETLNQRFVAEQPEKLIGDRTYDSDPLDEQLAAIGVEMFRPIAATVGEPRRRMGASCAAIGVVGRLSDCLPGWAIFAGWSYVTNISLRTSLPS